MSCWVWTKNSISRMPLHRVHVGDRGVVEIFAPHERRELAQQRLAGRKVAGARPRLDERGTLPILPDALVVADRGVDRDGNLGRAGIGSQPQIDPEHVIVDGALLQELHQPAGEPDVERCCLKPGREPRRRRIGEHDEVDVARIVELEGPHLAHGEHDQPAARLRPRRVGGTKLSGCHRGIEQMA